MLEELELVLGTLGWSALPLWCKALSATYALALIAHGNVGVVRNLVKGAFVTVRTMMRVGGGIHAWLRKPSKATLAAQAAVVIADEQRQENAEMRAYMKSLLVSLGAPVPMAEVVAATKASKALCGCGDGQVCSMCPDEKFKGAKSGPFGI